MSLIYFFADKVILFLTDGLPQDNLAHILATIRQENAKLDNQVVILTYGIGEGRQSVQVGWTEDRFYVKVSLHSL